jgi:hypothetical protein
LSKIEAGRLEIRRRFAPDELIADVHALMRVRAEEKQLAFAVEYEGRIPQTIESDPTRLRQVLVNLIGNAIKFTDAGSVRLVVRFLAEAPEAKLEFQIIDTGIGISPEQQAMLFQPFSQGDNSDTRQYGGSGLSLAISRRLIEPRQDPMPLAPENAAPPRRLSGRVLVVDDRHDIRYLTQHFLEEAGAAVLTADNGQQALAAVEQAKQEGTPRALRGRSLRSPPALCRPIARAACKPVVMIIWQNRSTGSALSSWLPAIARISP